jgi:universal stress protein E
VKFKIRRVLIAVTDGAARKVVDRAAQLAGSSKARVELFSVVRPPSPVLGMTRIDDPQTTRSLVEAKHRQLEKLARRLRDKGIAVTSTVAPHASVVDAIVRRAKQSKADLVAIEAHKHSLLARLFLSQNDYDLIRHCPVPLLIVKGGKVKPTAPILAALDPWHSIRKPQALDDLIAAVGHGVAESLHTMLHSVHVYSPLMGFAVLRIRTGGDPGLLAGRETTCGRYSPHFCQDECEVPNRQGPFAPAHGRSGLYSARAGQIP